MLDGGLGHGDRRPPAASNVLTRTARPCVSGTGAVRAVGGECGRGASSPRSSAVARSVASSSQTGARTPAVGEERPVETRRDPRDRSAVDGDHADARVLRVRSPGRRSRGTPPRAVGRHRRVAVDARSASVRAPDRRRRAGRRRGRWRGRGPSRRDAAPTVTTPDESASHDTPSCWNGPGVRLRSVPVPSAGTTYTCAGRSTIQPSPLRLGEERLDLARRLPALVLGVVAGVAGAAGERQALAVGRPAQVGDDRRAASPPCAPRPVRRSASRAASSPCPSRRAAT